MRRDPAPNLKMTLTRDLIDSEEEHLLNLEKDSVRSFVRKTGMGYHLFLSQFRSFQTTFSSLLRSQIREDQGAPSRCSRTKTNPTVILKLFLWTKTFFSEVGKERDVETPIAI